ncbi:MAG: uroporphyrinogen decarboxylase family protein [Desulfobacteraceae bacterium]|nr:uroporphyrinogen decarboxylase family protein [Desulfobacteraceae bacterium]
MKRGFELLGPMMQGELPERVPVICNLFEQGAKVMGLPIQEYYSDVDHVVEGQIRLAEIYGHDNLWATLYAAIDAEFFGSQKTIFAEDGPPNVGHLVIKNEEDIRKLTVPDNIHDSPVFAREMDLVKKLKEKGNKKLPVCAYVVASFSLPVLLMGVDKWLTLLHTGSPSAREELLAKCSDYTVKKTKALREAGVDLIAYANPIASATFINAKQFDELAAKWITLDFKGAGPQNLVYFSGGGRIEPLLNQIITASGAGAYYLNPFDSIPGAKAKIGKKGLLVGVINCMKLVTWTRDEVRADVKRIMEQGMPGGGFLMGPLMMPYAIPEKNLHSMMEAAHEFGQY